MSKRKGILLKEETYEMLKECRINDREALTKVLDRLIDTYKGVI